MWFSHTRQFPGLRLGLSIMPTSAYRGGGSFHLSSLVHPPFFLVTQPSFCAEPQFLAKELHVQPLVQLWMAKRPRSGQWDISRSHQLELPGKFFQREVWLVCVFVLCLSRSLVPGGSWRCSSHFVIMRQQAWGWKLDNPKESQKILRSDDVVMLRACPRLPFSWLDKKRPLFD